MTQPPFFLPTQIMWPITPAHWTVDSHIFSLNSRNSFVPTYSMCIAQIIQNQCVIYSLTQSRTCNKKVSSKYLHSGWEQAEYDFIIVWFSSHPLDSFLACLQIFIHTEKKQPAKLERKVEDKNSCHHKYKMYWSKWYILLILFSSYNVSL